jgi:LytS/YehU family sensor histidine kinase
MMLQTLVENAIKHGISALPEGGRLEIDGGLQNGALLLQVKNPRPASRVSSQVQDSEGIGLRNTAERLRLLFGADAHLDVDLSQPALATIRIRIPQAG